MDDDLQRIENLLSKLTHGLNEVKNGKKKIIKKNKTC